MRQWVRRRRLPLAVVGVLVAAWAVVAARLFVWPDLPPLPAHADAVVQLGGPGERRTLALDLVRQGRAPLVAISVSDDEIDRTWCHRGVNDGVPVLCFHPEPFTTRGEARDAAALAAQHGWRSIILVTTPDQAKRALLRVGRCYDGEVTVATTPLPWRLWPGQLLYQTGATVKAYTAETTC